jgi:hypothetical protein
MLRQNINFVSNKNGKTNLSFSFFLTNPDKKAVYSLPFAFRIGQAIYL